MTQTLGRRRQTPMRLRLVPGSLSLLKGIARAGFTEGQGAVERPRQHDGAGEMESARRRVPEMGVPRSTRIADGQSSAIRVESSTAGHSALKVKQAKVP